MRFYKDPLWIDLVCNVKKVIVFDKVLHASVSNQAS